MIFGLIPAWQASHPSLARELAETMRGSSAGHRRQLPARRWLSVKSPCPWFWCSARG
jgi:hypothetical protein